MTHVQQTSTKRSRRKPPALAAAGLLVLSLLGVVAVAGCGGSNATTPTTQASGQQMQVMATVTRGDLVDTSVAALQLTKNATGGATGVGRVMSGAGTSTVAQGQSVRVYFMQRPARFGQGSSQFPSPGTGQGSSQYPSPGTGQGSGQYPPGAGQGQGQAGQFPGFGAGNFAGAKNAPGKIDSVHVELK